MEESEGMKKEEFNKYKTLSKEHFWFKAREDIVSSILQKTGVRGENALEVGVGTGTMIECIRKCGFKRVDGVEVVRTKVDGYDEMFWVPFERFRTTKKYDAVFMFDSLEHFKEDEKMIKKCGSILKKGGYLVITVPACKAMFAKHDEENMHYRRYEKEELEKLLIKNNFKILRITFFNTILFPLLFLLRKVNAGGLTKVNPMANLVLDKIFSLEKYILRSQNLPYGASLMVVAKS